MRRELLSKPLHPEVLAWIEEIDEFQRRSDCKGVNRLKDKIGEIYEVVLVSKIAQHWRNGTSCIPQNPRRALEIFERAADIVNNYIFSVKAGLLHLDGSAGKQDRDKAEYYFWRMSTALKFTNPSSRQSSLRAVFGERAIPKEASDAVSALPGNGLESAEAALELVGSLTREPAHWPSKLLSVLYWLEKVAEKYPRLANYTIKHILAVSDSKELYLGSDETAERRRIEQLAYYWLKAADAGHPKAMLEIGSRYVQKLEGASQKYAKTIRRRAYPYLWGAFSQGEDVRHLTTRLEEDMSQSEILKLRESAEKCGLTTIR